MAEYKLYFDVVDNGFDLWWAGPFGLLFVAFSIFLVRFERRRRGNWIMQGYAWFFLLFSSAWTGLATWGPISDYLSVASAVANGKFLVVEGTVSNFSFKPDGRKKTERFCVGESCFSYHEYQSLYFHQTAENRGPIHNGIRVRIGHINGRIVRLEIAD
ncbi:MAG: hypothetical protein K0U74_16540 [Alphaproteobacteria bacterium]|nr:hypothetical protein [Alphaproteobacteria bacterium]